MCAIGLFRRAVPVAALAIAIGGPVWGQLEVDKLQQEAQGLLLKGQSARAADIYQKILQASPDSVSVLKDLAWIRATSKDPAVRRPAEAVTLAERAFERMIVGFNSRPDRPNVPPGYDKMQIIQVGAALTAAYASVGRFKSIATPDSEAKAKAAQLSRQAADDMTACNPASMDATTVNAWARDLAVAVNQRGPTPQTAQLVKELDALQRTVESGRAVTDGRPLPGLVRPR